jgi:hypothetical protein
MLTQLTTWLSGRVTGIFQYRCVSTHTRKVWKRKKEVFLRKLKDLMRRTKLPQIDVTGRYAPRPGLGKEEKRRATPYQFRMQLSHKLFPRER